MPEGNRGKDSGVSGWFERELNEDEDREWEIDGRSSVRERLAGGDGVQSAFFRFLLF